MARPVPSPATEEELQQGQPQNRRFSLSGPLLCGGPHKPCALITQLCLSPWAFYQRVIKMCFLNFKSIGSFSHLTSSDKSRCGGFDHLLGGKQNPIRLSQRQLWSQSKCCIAVKLNICLFSPRFVDMKAGRHKLHWPLEEESAIDES